ncbi:FecR domain-containing protein [Planctomicrobium sp. SH661]|uniref:FecR domain-containing protein n=1 Tax=Planctomicrobium sp. SH661 TaxID=3448124 RepID=UPI003F5AE1A9
MTSIPAPFQESTRLRELVERYCEGLLDDAEMAELQQSIATDDSARAYFLTCLTIHSGLKWEVRRGAFPQPDLISELLPAVPARNTLSKWLPLAIVALVVPMAVTLALWVLPTRNGELREPAASHSPATPAPAGGEAPGAVVATLTGITSRVLVERNGLSFPASAGMDIVANDALRVPSGGEALIRLPNSARIQLGPRSELAFKHEGRPELLSGFAEVDATQNPRDLSWSLRTPNSDTEIRTSRFAIGTRPELTHVRVAEGAVSVLRRSDGAMLDVAEGYCSTVAQDSFLRNPSRYGTALLVVSTKEYVSWNKFNRLVGDRLIDNRLWQSALSVKIRTLPELSPEDMEDCAVIIISVFEYGDDEQRFRDSGIADLKIPVICLEPAGFRVMGMTGHKLGTDFSYVPTAANLDLVQPGHPLAAGLDNQTLGLFPPKMKRHMGWARPAGDAHQIARIQGSENQWVLFGFDRGEAMFDRTAPERRVGFFISPQEIEEDSIVLQFIDAAIQWCVEQQSNRL